MRTGWKVGRLPSLGTMQITRTLSASLGTMQITRTLSVVISSCGLRWGCWGRDRGGRRLTDGIGSSIIADCLSQPNSQAGIDYGWIGVCHQTANRILFAAAPSQTVVRCKGYGKSVALYGVYGLGPWLERKSCVTIGTPLANGTVGSARQQGDDMSNANTYNKTVSRAAAEEDDDEARRLIELRALVQFGLGYALDPPTFSALAEIQAKPRAKQMKLQTKQEAGNISREQYLSRVNAAMEQFERQGVALLGRRQYDAVFGDGGPSESIIDAEIFLARPSE